ncbi:hypothetical protein HPB52_022748 [Rhipicephalus sanguineus]|uniref:Uncharacterized protein n=1 Tax=Rhipicephalus sanguineus TaxID=34632 RepID=A0A9D4QC91_RHISA|nr:hypothetical protein HPB52_022748 [Rhipicephalus sanguineus]
MSRNRKPLTLGEKLRIIEEAEKRNGATKASIARDLNIPESSLKTILAEAALPVDDEPEFGSLELPGSFADYVGADDDVAVCSEVSLDDIIETVVSSAIVDKYIGESARLIREMFNYARDHQPCVIFMDEIDAIGGRRFSEGTSADREIQRTLMELLNQMDGFDSLGQVKIIMATNRPDTLDPALLRPGRLDRKIEIPLPNEQARLDIVKIHATPITKHGEVDWEAVVKLSDGFNGADLRNVCTEAGMFAIRADREFVIEEDFMKAVRKVADNKKLESKLDYKPV